MRPRRALLTGVLLCAFAAACAQETPLPYSAPTGTTAAEVVEFTPDGWATQTVGAVSDEPIMLGRFGGWWGKAQRSDGARPAPQPGRTYVAVGASTRCRRPTGVEVTRAGDDLRVEFTGGDELPECLRPYGPAAVVSLPAATVAGVRTVNGLAPVSADGPGTLTGFVPVRDGSGAAELGRDVSGLLLPDPSPEAAAALATTPAAGQRGFAFVVTGCRATGAVLLVARDRVSAEPTGGEGVTCYLPERYLATFTVAGDDVPPAATPAS
jgi:hypothetical protein